MTLENFFKILCAHGRKTVAVLTRLTGSGSAHLRVESQWSGRGGKGGSVTAVRTESGGRWRCENWESVRKGNLTGAGGSQKKKTKPQTRNLVELCRNFGDLCITCCIWRNVWPLFFWLISVNNKTRSKARENIALYPYANAPYLCSHTKQEELLRQKMIPAEWCQIAGFLADRHNFRWFFQLFMAVLETVYDPLLALEALNDFRKIVKYSIISWKINFSGGQKFLS